jgi:hypothetical protein
MAGNTINNNKNHLSGKPDTTIHNNTNHLSGKLKQ